MEIGKIPLVLGLVDGGLETHIQAVDPFDEAGRGGDVTGVDMAPLSPGRQSFV